MFTRTKSIADRLGRRFLVAGIVVPALLLGGTACGLVDFTAEDGQADTDSQPVEDGDSNGDGGEGQDSGAGDEQAEQEDTGDGGTAGQEEAQNLDLETRHPNGTTLKVSRLSFEGNNILVDFEVINSSSKEITFHRGNNSSSALMLLDGQGSEYLLAEDEETAEIELTTGESVSGTLSFLGPLPDSAKELYLTTNTTTDEPERFDISEESDNTKYPEFVVQLIGSGE